MRFIFLSICTICFIQVELIFAQSSSILSDGADTLRMPEKLVINVNVSNGIIELKWKKEKHYLANKHLHIVLPFDVMLPNVMDDVGKFVVYHDYAKSSAVVYFEHLNALFGVVGLDYYIYNLPFQFNTEGIYELGVVGEPYLIKYQLPLVHTIPDLLNVSSSQMNSEEASVNAAGNDSTQSNKRPADCCSDAGPSTKRQCTDERYNKSMAEKGFEADSIIPGHSLYYQQYYLEILVFVLSDIANTFKSYYGENQYIQELVRYYIVYFNSIDMFLKKLYSGYEKIYLNIAKIVIEDDLLPFHFSTNNELHYSDVIQKVPEYLNNHNEEFPRDSFDCIFIHTRQPIFDMMGVVKGITRQSANLYEARKQNQFYEVVSIIIVTFSNEQANYAVALHEIGRVVGLYIDPQNKGLTEVGQCNSIMQEGGAKCSSCLQWSTQSILEFHQFFSTNVNRCFMLNEPRSMRPPGVSRFVTAHRQCRCFGFDSHFITPSGRIADLVGINGCSKLMQCLNKNGSVMCHSPTVLAFDGTPCTANKACWNQQCERLSVY